MPMADTTLTAVDGSQPVLQGHFDQFDARTSTGAVIMSCREIKCAQVLYTMGFFPEYFILFKHSVNMVFG